MTVGILPVAGQATRIQGLPKYLLPVPGGYLLERMLSRIDVPCFIGGNPDNAALLERYKRPEDTVYQVASATMCETILTARPLVGDENVLMGMPDTYWTDETVFQRLEERLDKGYICAVAIFRVDAEMAARMGVCITKADSIYLDSIEDKQPQTGSKWVWGAMAWSAEFWQYIDAKDANPSASMMRAIDRGVEITTCAFSNHYYDNGIPEDYFRCIRELTGAAQLTAR